MARKGPTPPRTASHPQHAVEHETGPGWVTFAAILLGLAGAMNVVHGLVAVSKSKFFTHDAVFVFGNLNTWGWIVMIYGVLLIIAAGSLRGGAEWARWFGIIAASLNIILQMAFMQAYPLWSLTVFFVDLLVIFALAAFAGRASRV